MHSGSRIFLLHLHYFLLHFEIKYQISHYGYYFLDVKDLEVLFNEQRKCIIETIKEIIKKEIKSAKNSILYSVQRGFDEIKAKMTVRSGQNETDLQKELDLNQSFDTYEAFVAFDNRLQDDELKVIMVLFTLQNIIVFYDNFRI